MEIKELAQGCVAQIHGDNTPADQKRRTQKAIESAIRQAVEDFRGAAMTRCEEMDTLYRSQNNHQHAAACAVMRAEIRKLPTDAIRSRRGRG